MGWFDWFRGKQRGGEMEKTPAGVPLIRHVRMEERAGGKERHGLPRSIQRNVEQREEAYARMFGEYVLVYEDSPHGPDPHMDVYVHEPGFGGRDYYTLVTGGMSDRRMNVPSEVPREHPRRGELVFYLPGDEVPRREFVAFLMQLGRFTHTYNTWLTWGHTIPNQEPPQPIFAGSNFVAVLFLFPIFDPDQSLPKSLVIENDPVHFLWPIPITIEELEFTRRHGIPALEEKFNEARLPFVFDEHRDWCV